ncbi:MAG: V-type ATPase subunit [Candidatus Izemoplasmatales bacterium]|jgi:V/A-type H+-transporting ATPase subunit C|nr:V-type ATPase subunit [Candidatus Izemoplasmatales bacterium]MDD3865915.1 V-type ATPase subunit [Candidatus Izemoplasmatales bacterium]
MIDFVGNAIVAKAKSIYGRRLKASDYEEMIKMKSVPEVAAFLRNHPNYDDILHDISVDTIHRGQLEVLIKKNAFSQTLRLIKFVQVKASEFFRLNLLQREIDIILEIIRSLISESFDTAISDVPYYMKQNASFDLFQTSSSKSLNELANSLIKTPYFAILTPFLGVANHDIDYVQIEHNLETYYYDEVFRRIHDNYRGKLRKELETIYLTRIELKNIIKIYRLKKFYHADFATIKNTLIQKYSRIEERKLDELISLPDPNSILAYLDKSEYQHFSDEKEYIYVEYYVEKINYNLAKRYMYFTNSVPKVFSAFLILSEIETENLTNIIEGIRYQLTDIEIKKMLIY